MACFWVWWGSGFSIAKGGPKWNFGDPPQHHRQRRLRQWLLGRNACERRQARRPQFGGRPVSLERRPAHHSSALGTALDGRRECEPGRQAAPPVVLQSKVQQTRSRPPP